MSNEQWHLQEFKKSLTAKGKVLPLVQEHLVRSKLEANKSRDSLHLHPSEISKKDWCPRSSWYTIKGYEGAPEKLGFQRLNVFAEGHAIHAKWQNWLYEIGVLYGRWSCSACQHEWSDQSPKSCPSCGSSIRPIYKEVPIQNERYRILGHSDGHVRTEKEEFLIEIKSVGAGTVRFDNYELFKECDGNLEEMWRKIRQPFQSHVRQAMLYMYCTGIHKMVFIYEWKPTQDVKEFVVEFQQEFVDPILKSCDLVLKGLESGIPPMRPLWVTSPEDQVCKWCQHKKTCWRNDEQSSDTPEPGLGERGVGGPSDEGVQQEVQGSEQARQGDSESSVQPRRVVRR